jgi:hypothetical protein
LFLINAIAIPASVYWLFVSALHPGAYARSALATLVALGGLSLAMWRWWSSGRGKLKG